MSFLSRNSILGVQDNIEREIVNVPEWGGKVLVRGLTASERDQYEESLIVTKGKDRGLNMQHARAKLAQIACIDEAGNRLFTAEDIPALGRKSSKALDRVTKAAQRLSGIGDDELEELSSPSETTPADVKSGDSPSPSDAPETNSATGSAQGNSTNSAPSTRSNQSARAEPIGTPPKSAT